MIALALGRRVDGSRGDSLLLSSLRCVSKPLEVIKVVKQDLLDDLLHGRLGLLEKQLHVFLLKVDRRRLF